MPSKVDIESSKTTKGRKESPKIEEFAIKKIGGTEEGDLSVKGKQHTPEEIYDNGMSEPQSGRISIEVVKTKKDTKEGSNGARKKPSSGHSRKNSDPLNHKSKGHRILANNNSPSTSQLRSSKQRSQTMLSPAMKNPLNMKLDTKLQKKRKEIQSITPLSVRSSPAMSFASPKQPLQNQTDVFISSNKLTLKKDIEWFREETRKRIKLEKEYLADQPSIQENLESQKQKHNKSKDPFRIPDIFDIVASLEEQPKRTSKKKRVREKKKEKPYKLFKAEKSNVLPTKSKSRLSFTNSNNSPEERERSASSSSVGTPNLNTPKLTKNVHHRSMQQLPRLSRSNSTHYGSAPRLQTQPSIFIDQALTTRDVPENQLLKLKQNAREKNHWVPDAIQTSCYDCETSFGLLKRKHHCRICGRIFCWKCSDNKIDGTPFELKGKIRVCNLCLEDLEELKNGRKVVNRINTESNTEVNSDDTIGIVEEESLHPFNGAITLPSSDSATPTQQDIDVPKEIYKPKMVEPMRDETTNGIKIFLPPKELESMPLFANDPEYLNILQNAEDHLAMFAYKLIQRDLRDVQWYPKIFETVKKVSKIIQVSSNDKMDARKYIKMKVLSMDCEPDIEYVPGIAFTGEVLHKKMATSFTNPKIILLRSPIQYYRDPYKVASFDILLKQEREYLSLIIKKIAEAQPDIMFVYGDVANIAVEALLEYGISVVIIKSSDNMLRISRSIGVPIIASIDDYRPHAPNKCSKIYFKHVGNQPMFFVESDAPQHGCTLLLKGNENMSRVRKTLHYLLLVGYSLYLESSLIYEMQGASHARLPSSEAFHNQIENVLHQLKNNMTPSEIVLPENDEYETSPLYSTSMNVRYRLPTSEEEVIPDPLQHSKGIMILFATHKYVKWDDNAPINEPAPIGSIYYSDTNDLTLGNFLIVKCLEKSSTPINESQYRSYRHDSGEVKIKIGTLNRHWKEDKSESMCIRTWSYCKKCKKCSDRAIPLSLNAFNYSFGKYCELLFYNDNTISRIPECGHRITRDHIHYFSYNDIICEVNYEPLTIYKIILPKNKLDYNLVYARVCYMEYMNTLQEQMERHFNIMESEMKVYNDSTHYADYQTMKRQYIELLKLFNTVQLQSNENAYTSIFKLTSIRNKIIQTERGWENMIAPLKQRHILVSMGEDPDRPGYISVEIKDNPHSLVKRSFTSSIKHLSKHKRTQSSSILEQREGKPVFVDDPCTLISNMLRSDYYKRVLKQKGSLEERIRDQSLNHLDDTFISNQTGASVKIIAYYFSQFHALREAVCDTPELGEDTLAHAMALSVIWKPTGGKSASTFIKTWDNRFVLKDLQRIELQSFNENGLKYFDHIANSIFDDQPSVMVKILGIFKIAITTKRGKTMKRNYIVMENLTYNRYVNVVYDLKGSERNRFQKDNSATQLDENLRKHMYEGSRSLHVSEPCKDTFTDCINSDTHFLSTLEIMDYSLLVCVDDESASLYVGIIDYVRQYTVDKQLETWVKSSIIPQNKAPTVILPQYYRNRFRSAMSRYFIVCHDRYTGKG